MCCLVRLRSRSSSHSSSQEPPLQKPEQHSISDSQSPSMYIQVQTISEFKPHPVPFVHPCMTSSVVQSRPPSISSQSSRASLNVASSTHSSESPTYDVPNTSSSNLRHFPSQMSEQGPPLAQSRQQRTPCRSLASATSTSSGHLERRSPLPHATVRRTSSSGGASDEEELVVVTRGKRYTPRIQFHCNRRERCK